MSGSAAFSGLKLSENSSSGGLDQRLFGEATKGPPDAGKNGTATVDRAPAQADQRPEPRSPSPKGPPKPIQRALPASEPVIRVNGEPVREPQPAGAARWATLAFDINVKPYRKDSFLFTDDEFEAMEDLKLELKRIHDLPATKNDIARIALQRLFEDYARRGGASAVVSRLAQKKT